MRNTALPPWAETPPRAWGRLVRPAGKDQHGGNTPTCVGKTGLLLEVQRLREKHPHVRGEDLVMSWATAPG